MASNLIAMASNLTAMASNLIVMASNLLAMASNLTVFACVAPNRNRMFTKVVRNLWHCMGNCAVEQLPQGVQRS